MSTADNDKKIPEGTDHVEAPIVPAEEHETRKPDEVAEDLHEHVAADEREFTAGIPETVRDDAEVEEVVQQADVVREDFDTEVDKITDDQPETTALEAESTPELDPELCAAITADLESFFNLLSKEPALADFPGEQQYVEALQGMLVEGRLFDKVKYGFTQEDGTLLLQEGPSVYDFYQKDKKDRQQNLIADAESADPEIQKIAKEGFG